MSFNISLPAIFLPGEDRNRIEGLLADQTDNDDNESVIHFSIYYDNENA